MADYYRLIARAIAGPGTTDEAWRAALYARARGALVIELCRITPPLSEPEITRECLLFEQAIHKIEANLTPRPSSAAAVPAPLPPVAEHPKQEPLLPEQGGSPMPGREPPPEAYTPGGNIRTFDSLEAPIASRDQCFPPCPIAPPMNEVEPRADISRGQGINGYMLETLVTNFPYGSLWELLDFEYEACRKNFGIERKFSGEVFYRAANDVFLGRASTPAIVAALRGKIYKIYFGFMHITEEDCREFLRSASDHFGAQYGPPSATCEINREQKTVFWDRSFGNVSLETDSFWCRNAIIYTSSVVRPRKRAWFGRVRSIGFRKFGS